MKIVLTALLFIISVSPSYANEETPTEVVKRCREVITEQLVKEYSETFGDISISLMSVNTTANENNNEATTKVSAWISNGMFNVNIKFKIDNKTCLIKPE